MLACGPVLPILFLTHQGRNKSKLSSRCERYLSTLFLALREEWKQSQIGEGFSLTLSTHCQKLLQAEKLEAFPVYEGRLREFQANNPYLDCLTSYLEGILGYSFMARKDNSIFPSVQMYSKVARTRKSLDYRNRRKVLFREQQRFFFLYKTFNVSFQSQPLIGLSGQQLHTAPRKLSSCQKEQQLIIRSEYIRAKEC